MLIGRRRSVSDPRRLGRSTWAPGIAYRSAEARGPDAARVSRASGRGDEQPDRRPDEPAGDDPDRRARHERHGDPDRRPDDRRDELAPAGDEPDGEPDHRGREDDVDAEAGPGRGSAPPRTTPASVARFHGMNVDADRRRSSSPIRRSGRSAGSGRSTSAKASSVSRWAMTRASRRAARRAATARAPRSRAGGGR